jgi:hypothetical protein
MRVDPLDRVFIHGSDLDSSDFEGSIATRTDDSVLVIYSLRASGATGIRDLLHMIGTNRFKI